MLKKFNRFTNAMIGYLIITMIWFLLFIANLYLMVGILTITQATNLAVFIFSPISYIIYRSGVAFTKKVAPDDLFKKNKAGYNE